MDAETQGNNNANDVMKMNRAKYGVEEILDESIECAVRLGSLDTSKLIVQQE